jgi:hypothetical protein
MENEDLKKQQDLTWLENLQKNSWEPEVIVSGISLAVLFIIPSSLFDYSILMIQDYGLEHIPALLVLGYFSLIISVFKIFLITHLFLRFMWAGMLGITYAFPEGVLKNNLFKFSQDLDYPHPRVYLLKLERWCSMIYGYPLSVVIPIFWITAYLILLIAVYLVFNLDFQVVYIVFISSFLLVVVVGAIVKKSKLKSFVGTSMNGTISAVFASHLGKWTMVWFSLLLVVAALPFILSDLNGFTYYQPMTNLEDEFYDAPDQSRYFEEYNTDKVRFPRVWTESMTVSGDKLHLYLAKYARDERDLPRIQTLLSTSDYDTLGWKKLEKVEDTYQVFLNDSLVTSEKWILTTSGITGQKAFFGIIPIAELPQGIHEIRIDKLVYIPPFIFTGNELRYRKRWARFNFIKE